jgi:uncharacterized membrane protein
MVTVINTTDLISKVDDKQVKLFRWTYFALPLGLLLLSVILTAFFYSLLPSEVAYHFNGDLPDKWIGRGAAIAWLIVPQFFLVFIGITLSGIGSVISRRYELADISYVRRILMTMGNMVALPQIILIFAMLDIFLYNAYEIRLLPLWVIIIAVLLIGTIILGIFFLQTLRNSRRSGVSNIQEN